MAGAFAVTGARRRQRLSLPLPGGRTLRRGWPAGTAGPCGGRCAVHTRWMTTAGGAAGRRHRAAVTSDRGVACRCDTGPLRRLSERRRCGAVLWEESFGGVVRSARSDTAPGGAAMSEAARPSARPVSPSESVVSSPSRVDPWPRPLRRAGVAVQLGTAVSDRQPRRRVDGGGCRRPPGRAVGPVSTRAGLRCQCRVGPACRNHAQARRPYRGGVSSTSLPCHWSP